MHQYKDLLKAFLAEWIKDCRKGRSITQEVMAEQLHVSVRSYAYLERGTYGCSAATLMFFFLLLTDEEIVQLRIEFRTLVERVDGI